MTVAYSCTNRIGQPKERFSTARAARKALALKWAFHKRRYPRIYKCEAGHYHLTGWSQL